MAPHVLRLRRTDQSNQHLLVHVSSAGPRELDLKLIGTEHECLYHGSVQESNIKSLQANAYTGDLQEWKDILKYTLLHNEAANRKSLSGIEVVAAISGNTLTITFRKNVGGITQRLGAIKLTQDDEKEEVRSFEWVDTAVSDADELRSQVHVLQESMTSQIDEVAKLNQQLDELVKAKQEHEEEMLKKFAALLNAKKLKLRDQQRLLAGAKIDPRTARAVSEARDGNGGRQAGSSRSGKRKAEVIGEPSEVEADAEDEDAFDGDEARQETPPRSDKEDDDEDDLDGPPNMNGRTVNKAKTAGNASNAAMDIGKAPPPRRELPFGGKANSATATTSTATTAFRDDDDYETDD